MRAQAFFSSFAFDHMNSSISGWSTLRMTIFAARRVRPPDFMTPANASKPFMKETGPLAFPPVDKWSFEDRRDERVDAVPDPYLDSIPSVWASCIIDRISSWTE